MSGNLMASSLLASHPPVSREPQAPQSESRGQGAGFETLLAELDPPNASASAARGDNGSAPHAGRAAPPSDPSALGTTRATLTANIDAALSSLAKVASRGPAPAPPRAPEQTVATAARVAPSADPGAPETPRGALATQVDAASSSLAAVASRAQGQAGPPAATTARAAAAADPGAPEAFQATLMTDIDAVSSSSATGAAPAPRPSIAAAKTMSAASRAAARASRDELRRRQVLVAKGLLARARTGAGPRCRQAGAQGRARPAFGGSASVDAIAHGADGKAP